VALCNEEGCTGSSQIEAQSPVLRPTSQEIADTLDVLNATVTRLIQQLEQDLEARLLHRTTRPVTVAPEGAI